VIGDDHVEPVHGEIGEQLFEVTLRADHPDLFLHRHDRFENPVGDQLGDRIDDADVEDGRSARLAALHPLGKFGAEREDFVGVLIHELTGIGKHEAPSYPVE